MQGHFNELIGKKYQHADVRFTDGSKKSNSVGAGIFGKNISESHKLPKICSVFSAEAAAILRAVTQPSTTSILVVTDSASALQAIESPMNKHPFIQRIQRTLDELEIDVSFMWVPGHCGIHGNEQADLLANRGRQSRLLTPKAPADDVRLWVKNVVWDSWSLRWHQDQTTFARKIKPNVERWDDLASRRDQIVLSRLRTGHTRLSHNMGANGDGFRISCETCHTHNSVEHFIVRCPTLEFLRREHDIACVQTALSGDKERQAKLLKFLKQANIYDAI